MKKLIVVSVCFLFCVIAIPLHAFSLSGFQNPYGIVVDSLSNTIYISNVNGDPSLRDDNGFISRLKSDGTVDQLKFIDGAVKEVTLNAPKGMEIVGKYLYVADIDKLRVFELATGKFSFDINFGDLPVTHFYDVALGPDDVLYVTDGPGNVIYKLDTKKYHEVTTFVSGDMLGEPHGIAWHPGRQMFVVACSSGGQVIAFDRSGRRQPLPLVALKTPEGMTVDDLGDIYVSSQSLNSIFRLTPSFVMSSFSLGLSQPVGLGYNRGTMEIAAALFDKGIVQTMLLKMPQK